jgi:hypothetical protein
MWHFRLSQPFLALLGVLSAASCVDQGSPPRFLDLIGKQTVYVGTRYDLTLRASDPDGDQMLFSFVSGVST